MDFHPGLQMLMSGKVAERPKTAPDKFANQFIGETKAETRERLRKKNDDEERSMKEKLRLKAMALYEEELTIPAALDLGLKSSSRSQLRVLCKTVILEASQTAKRKYSQSNLSSGEWSNKDGNEGNDDAISRLRQLQKERLIISRMGFADRANALDMEIEEMRVKAATAKHDQEQKLLGDNLEVLERKMTRKKDRMEVMMGAEKHKLEEDLAKEFRKMRQRQRQEFLRVLENAERRALGKVKKCNCGNWYLCRHNKVRLSVISITLFCMLIHASYVALFAFTAPFSVQLSHCPSPPSDTPSLLHTPTHHPPYHIHRLPRITRVAPPRR